MPDCLAASDPVKFIDPAQRNDAPAMPRNAEGEEQSDLERSLEMSEARPTGSRSEGAGEQGIGVRIR